MIAIKCEFCGSNQLFKRDGFFQCEHCRTKYSLEEARKLLGKVKIEGNVSVKEADFIIRAGVLEKYNGSDVNVVIPDNVMAIGSEAFTNCTGLTNVEISNNVTMINNGHFAKGAFSQCTNLKKIVLPKGLLEIGNGAFCSCKSLTEVNIPCSVTRIGEWAFNGCTSLSKITIPNSVKEIGWWAFKDCNNLINVLAPQKFENVFEAAKANTEKKAAERRARGVCQYCGSTFKGVFSKVCSKCETPKDY